MEALALRFTAPLMSFGGVAVDENGVTREFPAQSMMTGLIANALGYHHAETSRLQELQSRLRYAARRDRPGAHLIDFQTVSLGQDFMLQGWTTWRAPEKRKGGSASKTTHIRRRHYLADAAYTVVLTLEPIEGDPDLSAVEAALRAPERPLFLGRKTCLPSTPLVWERVTAGSLKEALATLPPWAKGTSKEVMAWWPHDGQGEPDPADRQRVIHLTDERDWKNQIHVGRRSLTEGLIELGEEAGDERTG